MRIIMLPHNGCYNHGCEAIVRSTIEILGLSQKEALLYSFDADNDIKYDMDKICKIIPNNSPDYHSTFLRKKWFAVKEKILSGDRDLEEISYIHRKVIRNKNGLLALSVGGDNYCYSGMQHILSENLKLFTYNNIKSVLWACSIEEQMLNAKVIDELKKHNLISARESLTYDLLKDIGIDGNKIIMCSDPAFTLRTEKVRLYDSFFESGDVIGINVSDLMKSFNAYPDATYKNFRRLIEHILNSTNYNIILIPHVIQEGNDDRIPLSQLASEFNLDRVLFAKEDLNCMQLKYLISRCKMFVGCRTHSTIAAYSTCVPTLVVGYSVKARGICRDIFGTYEDLLIDGRNFEDDNDLTDKFMAFSEREEELRAHLKKNMPSYIERAYAAKKAVLELM